MTPPASLVLALKSYDPKLRVTWKPVAEEFWVEQPLATADPELVRAHTTTLTGRLDLLVRGTREWLAQARQIEAAKSAGDGYRGIMFIPRDMIDRESLILKTLYESDFAKQGGQSGINAKFDQAAGAYYAAKEKARIDRAGDMARDHYDVMAWKSHARQATPMGEAGETNVVTERRDGYVVRSRKVSA